VRERHHDRSLSTIRPVIGWALLGAFLAMVGLWVAFGFAPALVEHAPAALRAFGEPYAFWPILAGTVAGAGAAWALAPGIRGGGEGGGEGGGHLSPLAVAILGPAALAMIFSAYWPCEAEGSQFWGSLRHALEAFEGYVAEPFGEVPQCPAEFPQTLMVGVLFGKATLVLVLGIGLAYVLRRSLDSVRTRFARQVVVLSGVTEEGVDVARWVASPANLPRRRHLVLLDDGSELDRARELARELGKTAKVIVLGVDVSDRASVDAFMRARGRRGIQGLYLMSPDSSANLKALDAFLGAHERSTAAAHRTEVPGRVVIRVENPWHADDWRRQRMIDNPGWLFDALSEREIAARHVVGNLKARGIDRVVISDSDPFSLAVLSELSFEHRIDAYFARVRANAAADSAPQKLATPQAVLVGGQGKFVADHFRQQMRRFGVVHADGIVDVRPDEDREHAMSRLLRTGYRPALIVNDVGRAGAEHDSTFLAVRHPDWVIFDWDPQSHGLAHEPLLGKLSVVGPTMAPVPDFGLDIWDRLGAIQHQTYLINFQGGVPASYDPGRKRGLWEGLSAFARESNVRSFATFARSLAGLARRRSLGTDIGTPGGQVPAPIEDPAEIRELAIREHESWVAHHAEYGFRYGPERKGKRHPDMVEWDRLGPGDQDKDVQSVLATNELLKALGFVLVEAT